MSIASEITRINNNIANAYGAIDSKGGTLPVTQNSANLATAINSISGGGSINIYTQTIEPEHKEGIWLDTNNTFDKIEFADVIFAEGKFNITKMNNLQDMPYRFYAGNVVSIGTDIYLIGNGTVDTTAHQHKIYKYDPLTDTYTEWMDLPYNTYRNGCEVIDNYIYLINGGESSSRKIFLKIDINNKTYSTLATVPVSSYNAGLAYVDGYIYHFGGATTQTQAYKYNILQNSWTAIANIPFSFTSEKCVAIGTNIWLFAPNGGVYKYDTLTNTYSSKLADYPQVEKEYIGCQVIGTDIYMFGGGTGQTPAYKYDTLTNTFTLLENCIYRFSGAQLTYIPDLHSIYLFDGNDNEGTSKKVQIFEFPPIEGFTDNSIVIKNGITYSTQLYTNENIEGRALNYFDNIYTYTDENGLEQIYDTYYGNGTNWVQI